MIVLDSSAILADLRGEPGGEAVRPHLGNAKISAVNFGEIVSLLMRAGADARSLAAIVDRIDVEIVDFDAALALDAGWLAELSSVAGLSLGDRCCLALARKLRLAVLTADRAWLAVAEAAGVEIRTIR